MQAGDGADPKAFEKAAKAADKLGEAIAMTTDKIMEMRKDIDGKQVGLVDLDCLLHCPVSVREHWIWVHGIR